MKNILVFLAFLSTSLSASAQYGYRDSNRIGINAGINQFTLTTSDFDTKPAMGWNLGLSVRGNFYNDFDMVYGIQFSENNYTVATYNGLSKEDVKYKISSAQISLLLSYKLIENHLSVELGPMLQVNGKATIEDTDEDNIVAGELYTAKELAEISNFSFYPTIGITAGIRQLRANITYQYGVTNLLHNIEGADFNGHGGILSGNLIFYL